MATKSKKNQISFSRLTAVSRDIAYIATVPDDHELGTPFVAICQYNAGEWSYEAFNFEIASMSLFGPPLIEHRILHVLSEDGILVNFHDKARSVVKVRQSAEVEDLDLGYLTKIRQIGDTLFAVGHGGQFYLKPAHDEWRIPDRSVFFRKGQDEEIRSLTRKYYGSDFTPSDKDWEEFGRISRANTPDIFWSVGGSEPNDVYLCSELEKLYWFDGRRLTEVDSEADRPLLGVLVEAPDRVWVCGREGLVLFGDHKSGFREIFYDTDEDFNGMALFGGKIYFSGGGAPNPLVCYDGRKFERIRTGLKPEIQQVSAIDAAADALWVMGEKDLLRFDGTTWERIDFPGNDPIR